MRASGRSISGSSGLSTGTYTIEASAETLVDVPRDSGTDAVIAAGEILDGEIQFPAIRTGSRSRWSKATPTGSTCAAAAGTTARWVIRTWSSTTPTAWRSSPTTISTADNARIDYTAAVGGATSSPRREGTRGTPGTTSLA